MTQEEIEETLHHVDKILDNSISSYKEAVKRLDEKDVDDISKREEINHLHELYSRQIIDYINNSFPLSDIVPYVDINDEKYYQANGYMRMFLYSYANKRQGEFAQIKNSFLNFLDN